MKVTAWVATDRVGSQVNWIVDIDNEDLEGLEGEERNDFIDERVQETIVNRIEWGWREEQMTKQPEEKDAADVPFRGKPSDTQHVVTGCGTLHLIRIWNERRDKLKAIQPSYGHTGTCESAHIEALQRLFNRCLKHGDTIEMLARELGGLRCGKTIMGGASSCPDAIACALKMKVEVPE